MNVCYVCSEYPLPDIASRGGIGSFVQTLGRALVKQGHRVFVLRFYPSEGISEDQGVRVMKLSTRHWLAPNVLSRRRILSRAIKALEREHGIDIIEAGEGTSAMLPWSGALPTVVRLHGGHHFFCHFAGVKTRRLQATVEKHYLRRIDFLVGVSQFVVTETARLVRLNRANVPVIPNPIDVDEFRPLPEVKAQRGTIVFAGTIVRQKGIHELIEAMPIILKKFPEAKLLVAGRDYRIPRTRLSTRAFLEKGMDDRTKETARFLGHVEHSQMPGLFRRGHVCVFPSHMESQGIVAVEAMACGRPTVFTKLGPGPEVIEDGVSGLLCDPYDPKDIAEKIITILKDPELAARLGRNARRRVEERFSTDVLVPKNIEFYEECIRSFKAKRRKHAFRRNRMESRR